MQEEDIWLTDSPKPGTCPLCSKPLSGSRELSQSQRTMVTCLSCGFSAPFVQRRHREKQASEERATSAPTSQSATGSSVWIDPAVSAFLGKQIVDAGNAAREPKKPQAGPVTPIPPVARVPQYTDNVKVRPKYRRSHSEAIQNGDLTRIPTLPPPVIWQYESPDFEVESSLSTLSLIVDAPTRPETTASPRSTKRLPHIDEVDTAVVSRTNSLTPIDEIDTVPPTRTQNSTNIDQIDTVPPRVTTQSGRSLELAKQASTLALNPISSLAADLFGHKGPGGKVILDDPASWTAGGAARSAYARRIAERRHTGQKRQHSFNLLDRLRWWLLHPGRIEFILWLGGTILLVSVTFMLLLVTAASFSWMTPIVSNGPGTHALLNSSGSGSNTTGTSPTTVTASGITLTLLSLEPLAPGRPILLLGSGCTAQGRVTFTDEKNRSMLNINSRSNSVTADKKGAFAVKLGDSSWNAGSHLILVSDVATGHVVTFPVVVALAQYGKKGSTPTPVTAQPGFTATPSLSNGSGGGPTPVNSTPGSTPTAAKPSPTPTQPTATPTQGGSTPTVTPATTATAGTTPTSTATTSSSTDNMGAQYMAANVGSTPLHASTHLDAWIWLLILGYALSMVMLGVAGIVRRRQR